MASQKSPILLKKTALILSVLYILFFSLFALDVFDNNQSIVALVVGLVVHMMPSLLLIVALLIAWKREFVGGLLFVILSIVSFFFFHVLQNPVSFIIVCLPMLIIGGLFIYVGKKS